MDLFKAMGLSASGLNAQRTMINVISMNLANVHTTRTAEGGPYRRRQAMFSPVPWNPPFSDILSNRIEMVGHLLRTHPNHFPQFDILPWRIEEGNGGINAEIIEDPSGFRMIHDPSHPDADESGYVQLPNVNLIEEMVNLMGAVRSYEANVTAFNAAKSMALKALEIGR
jgi:flagellar basal-body rod protein FlgC